MILEKNIKIFVLQLSDDLTADSFAIFSRANNEDPLPYLKLKEDVLPTKLTRTFVAGQILWLETRDDLAFVAPSKF